MSEVLISRPWEPTGPCWTSCTTPSLPSEASVRIILFCFFSIKEISRILVRNKCEPQRGSLSSRKAGERNVAERGHGCPCGEQPLDEVDGNSAQGKETSRYRRCFWCSRVYNRWSSRTGPQSVSLNYFSFIIVKLFYHVYFITQGVKL